MRPATSISFASGMTNPPTSDHLVFFYVPEKTTSPKVYPNYLHGPSTALGIAQIIFGVLCILFNAISVGYFFPFHTRGVYGHGFWNGILFIVTGVLGLMAGKKKTKFQIVAYMAMCIVSSIVSVTIMAIGIVGATEKNNYYQRNGSFAHEDYNLEIAMEACMAISGFVESILGICGAALGWKAVVCSPAAQPEMDLSSGDQVSTNGQVIYLAKGQRAHYAFGPPTAMTPQQGPDDRKATCQTTSSVTVTWVHPLSQPRTSTGVTKSFSETDPCPPYSLHPPTTSQH